MKINISSESEIQNQIYKGYEKMNNSDLILMVQNGIKKQRNDEIQRG